MKKKNKSNKIQALFIIPQDVKLVKPSILKTPSHLSSFKRFTKLFGEKKENICPIFYFLDQKRPFTFFMGAIIHIFMVAITFIRNRHLGCK